MEPVLEEQVNKAVLRKSKLKYFIIYGVIFDQQEPQLSLQSLVSPAYYLSLAAFPSGRKHLRPADD